MSNEKQAHPVPESDPKKRECRDAIAAYVAPAFETPLEDDRRLSLRDFRKKYGFSNDTIYAVGGNKRIQAAKAFRKEQRAAKEVGQTGRPVDEYRQRYENLLEKWLLMVDYLNREKDIDIESILEHHTLPGIERASRGPLPQRRRRS